MGDLAKSLEDMSNTCISLGPEGSYYATSPAIGAAWNNLPSSFECLMNRQQDDRVVKSVALGIKKTWFAIWPDGGSSCSLGDEYPDLERLLKQHGKAGVNV